TGAVTSLAFSSDGRQIVSGSKDATVRLWKVEGGKEIRYVQHPHLAPVTRVGFTEKGSKILAGSGPFHGPGGKNRWNILMIGSATGAVLHTDNHNDSDKKTDWFAYAFSPDGKRIITMGSWATGACFLGVTSYNNFKMQYYVKNDM